MAQPMTGIPQEAPILSPQGSDGKLKTQDIKSKQNTKIKLFAAMAFSLIALGVGIYLTQRGFSLPHSQAVPYLLAGPLLLGASTTTFAITYIGHLNGTKKGHLPNFKLDAADIKMV